MTPASGDAPPSSSAASPSAVAVAVVPPSSDPQQSQSPSSTTPPPSPRALSRCVSDDESSFPRALARRQSTNERISEILENARGRAEVMGGAFSASRSAPASPPLRSYSRDDSTNDENIGIISRGPDRNYQSMNAAPPELPGGVRPRKSVHSTRSSLPARVDEDAEEDYDAVVAREEREERERLARAREPWYTVFLSTFQSIELENKGSVARDHLALERTFLAWLRTSLAFASIGIAVTQLFRLNSSIANPDSRSHTLRQLGKPLGATFLAISILILFLGYSRYVRSQKWIMQGKFPASRGTVIVVSLVAFALMAVSLVVVVVVGPSGTE
ncbi:hypothetical protein C8035_v000165 [Colletotrichum spinosum]|uniref:DUF202 domain-containing protein n=1 Tax=Colletotrichum spinosum TaxID=1347390 RepID=A0A4R8PU67_9PEZI|nr:hypothetical protein C8035_v000165 [Colletotrichum spinosum]